MHLWFIPYKYNKLFIYLDKDGLSQYNLAPFDELYEIEKSFVINRS